MSLVSCIRFDEQKGSLQQAIEKALDLINFKFSSSIKKIAVKPNMCYYWDYSTGETTDPRFVGEVIDTIRNQISDGVEISIVESDASAMKCKYSFRMLGYEKMATEKGVKMVNLTDDEAEDVETKVRNKTFVLSVPRTITEADLFINVPKIKYMREVTITGALKNIYGCNPYPQKYKFHKQLDQVIVGLNKVMKPDLCILDGLIVNGIRSLKLGMILASIDPVAMDAAASEIADITPSSVGHIRLAFQEKLGNINFTSKGESMDYFKKRFPKKTFKYRTRRILASIYDNLLPS